MIPRYARPMIGWAHDVELCSHDVPLEVCDAHDGGDFRPSDSKYDDE